VILEIQDLMDFKVGKVNRERRVIEVLLVLPENVVVMAHQDLMVSPALMVSLTYVELHVTFGKWDNSVVEC